VIECDERDESEELPEEDDEEEEEEESESTDSEAVVDDSDTTEEEREEELREGVWNSQHFSKHSISFLQTTPLLDARATKSSRWEHAASEAR